VTTYNPTIYQCDDTPHITADGTHFKTWKASSYRYVALSRDLLSRWGGPFEYGDYIVIEGTGDRDGVYQVRDTMNPKWTNRVDILTTNDRFKYNNITMYKYVKEEEYLLTENK
jgi:3D (Asp-Asp-Asp) domain-containing protein